MQMRYVFLARKNNRVVITKMRETAPCPKSRACFDVGIAAPRPKLVIYKRNAPGTWTANAWTGLMSGRNFAGWTILKLDIVESGVSDSEIASIG